MKRRQKKKRYKRLYGHNPPKGVDGRYMFHVQCGTDLAAGSERTGYCSSEWQKARQSCLQGQKIEISIDTETFSNALAAVAQAISDFAAAVSQTFAEMAKQYRKPVIEQIEEPPVVVARNLTERRKRCRRKEWRAFRR